MGGDRVMLIILDKASKEIKKNLGTNSLYPKGDLPIFENENEIYVRIDDNSVFSKLIQSAYYYELELDENNHVTNVIVHKTLEEYRAEQPIESQPPTAFDELSNHVLGVDFRVAMLELDM